MCRRQHRKTRRAGRKKIIGGGKEEEIFETTHSKFPNKNLLRPFTCVGGEELPSSLGPLQSTRCDPKNSHLSFFYKRGTVCFDVDSFEREPHPRAQLISRKICRTGSGCTYLPKWQKHHQLPIMQKREASNKSLFSLYTRRVPYSTIFLISANVLPLPTYLPIGEGKLTRPQRTSGGKSALSGPFCIFPPRRISL